MEGLEMMEFRTKLSEGGRVILPINCRQALHLTIGDELIIRVNDDEAQLYSLEHALKRAQALVKKRNKKAISLTDMLIQERRAEAKNE
jgi:bifunctional DNA-binding transcriptional regulator/antitoxin component of YhaV-PrlF toxin-antitoxin module